MPSVSNVSQTHQNSIGFSQSLETIDTNSFSSEKMTDQNLSNKELQQLITTKEKNGTNGK